MYLLDSWWWLERSYEIGPVWSSILPSVQVFSQNLIIMFLWISAWSNQLFLQNKLTKQPHFLHVDTTSKKLRVSQIFFVWAWSKMVVPILCLNYKSDCISRINRWDKLIVCMLIQITTIKSWSIFFWGVIVKNGYGQYGHETLKLTVSQKWTDGMKWVFVCCYKFRKTKSWFNYFWVDVVKNDHGLLVHETLYLKNKFMNWTDFLNADSDAIIFG